MGKVTKKTIFSIDGNEYEYDLNLNAMINFEEVTGKELMNIKEGDTFNLKEIRALLWAGLHEEDNKLTLEAVGKLMRPDNMQDISNKIMEAYDNAMPEAEGEDTGKNTNRSTG